MYKANSCQLKAKEIFVSQKNPRESGEGTEVICVDNGSSPSKNEIVMIFVSYIALYPTKETDDLDAHTGKRKCARDLNTRLSLTCLNCNLPICVSLGIINKVDLFNH